jgi:trans-aconitate methyltransferase
MNEAFDVNAYWIARGREYVAEKFPEEYHRLQERFLLDTLKALGLPFRRILELGCGFGRITRLLADAYPEATITAVDLSEQQLQNARRYCERRENVTFATYDFYSDAPIRGGHHDLAVAIEVFLHHPETFLPGFLRQLSAAATFILHIDWSEDWPWPRPEHVWIHDYVALYRDLGLECVAVPLPERVAGLQQKLFLAARQLSDAARALEQKAERSAPGAPPPIVKWYVQLERAVADLQLFVPENASLILINDDEWGARIAQLAPRRVLPFLERNGKSWGRPVDDTNAIEELTRMHRAGATHIAVSWNSFWWLEHYAKFFAHVTQSCRCVTRNERVIVFELPR